MKEKLYTYEGETYTFGELCKHLQDPAVPKDYIEQFVKELDFDGRLSNESLFTLYTIWSCGTAVPKEVFEKRVASAFKKHRPDVRRYKTQRERGWEYHDGSTAE